MLFRSSFIDEDGNDWVKEGTFKLFNSQLNIMHTHAPISGIFALDSKFIENLYLPHDSVLNIGVNEGQLRKFNTDKIETTELKDSEGKIYSVEGINLKNYVNNPYKSLIFEKADHSFKFEADSLKYGNWDNIYLALSMKEKRGESDFGEEMIPHDRISILKDGGDIWLDDIRYITFTRK